jgi:hypothetical protein
MIAKKQRLIIGVSGLIIFAAAGAIYLGLSKAVSSTSDNVVNVDLSTGIIVGSMTKTNGRLVFNTTNNTPTPSVLAQSLERFRNTDPQYSQFENIPNAEFDLTKMINQSSPDLNQFKFNGSATSQGQNGQFRTICEFSHLNYDDPIVSPGIAGASHLHMYFGNTKVDASTTALDIVDKGGSTCDGFGANRTAYWYPALFDNNGKVRIPNLVNMYYKAENVAQPAGGYTAMPQGLVMIANNSMATSPQATNYENGWYCTTSIYVATGDRLPTIPDCSPPNTLGLKVSYPRCWDGVNLDSADHKSHVVYASTSYPSQCPATHPKVLPTVTALMEWELSEPITGGWYLASDKHAGMNVPGGTTFHGDWFGGWNKDVAKAFNDGCLKTEWNCQVGYLGNAGLPVNYGGAINQLKPTTQKYIGKGPQIIDLNN